MGVHPWPGIDPASAYMTMTGGAWAAPMHAAGAALNALGGQVHATVAVSEVNDTIVGESWTGQARIKAAASVTELNGNQTDYGLLSMLKSEILHSAGELHTTTVPQMVTHIQANANRGEWGIDNAINPSVLGMLTPRLIDLDTEYYGFMWPNNASSGLRYGAGLDALGAALSGLSALPSLAGGSVAAPAMAAADVGANAGISMMSAVMSATEQAATTAISPATTGASQASSLLGQAPLSAPNTPATSGISPLANVTSHPPVSSTLPQTQAPTTGMFLPPSSAAVNAPAPSPPVQTMNPAVGGTAGAAPGVTSFAKPAEPFSPPPPPSGGKAVGLQPGMLNASALRGPVSAGPSSTALLTKPLTAASSLATQPLAYVSPTVPPSQPAPPSHALLEPGTIQTLQPPSTPPQTPPPPTATPQPAVPQDAPPASSTGPTGTGTNGTDTQMLGTGLGGAPQAPKFPFPLDPDPAPPVPPVGEMNPQQLQDAWAKLVTDRNSYNERCAGRVFQLPAQQGAYDSCLIDQRATIAREAELRQRYRDLGIPEPPPDRAFGSPAPPSNAPSTEQPAPTTQQAPPATEQSPPQPSQETQPPGPPQNEPTFPPPTQIRGFTSHGEQQVAGRDGGVGVNESALEDAVEHPLSPPTFRPDQQGGTYTYIGKDARVSLNSAGQIVTAWATNHEGWLNP